MLYLSILILAFIIYRYRLSDAHVGSIEYIFYILLSFMIIIAFKTQRITLS